MADLIATGEVFATGASTTGPYTLTIGGSAVSQAVVTAIHQTDWQGRVALSSTPRTNWTPFSGLTNNAPSNLTLTTGQPDPAGGNSGATFTVTKAQTAGQGGVGGYVFPSASAPTTGNIEWSMWVKASRAGIVMSAFTNAQASGGAVFFTTTGGWQLVSGTGPTRASNALNLYGSSFTSGSKLLAVGDSFTVAFIGLYSSGASAPVIPAPTAPVTVTDYTVSGRTVSLGQVPANAMLDWDGQGTFGNWSWPSTLPLPIANGSLQYAPIIEPVLATSMETGAPKYRRRMTYVPETCQATVELTGDQWTTLINFYNTMLECVNPFDWKDFRTGGTATYVFTKQPAPVQMQDQPKYWSVQLQLLKVA